MRRRYTHNDVLALGSGITLLGAIRALSETGARVLALPDADGPATRSRWFRPAPRTLSGLTPSRLASGLQHLPSGTVLMPCSDAWARAVAALPDEAIRRHPASVAPLGAIDVLVDKNLFRDALGRLGLPHPKTVTLKSESEISESMFESAFLKPVNSQEFFARFGVKAFRVSGKSEAAAKFSSCADAGLEMLLQEYIPGPPTNHYFIDGFIDRHGVTQARFARRRLRMSPPDFGNSTLMESVPLTDTGSAARTLDTLLAAIRYRGVFSAEFKRDERTREFNLIEVNARPWWYVEFAARCGVNVCELAMRDALEQSVTTVSGYAVGRRCVFPYYDIDAIRAEVGAGRLSLGAAALSWLGAYQPIFRWSDPMPAVGGVLEMVRRRLAVFA